MEFTLKRQEIVVPSPPPPLHVVAVPEIDHAVPQLYTPFLFFFPPSSAPPSSASLTHSLAGALAAFPPVAGRLKPRSNGAGFDVECHNQGAVFVEAHATATLDQLLNTGTGDVPGGMYQPSPLWLSLCPNPYKEECADKPLLFTQLTRLECGGVVVAVLLHHLVADGNAQMHFIASWAELARGKPITSHPHLNRACMQARSPPCATFEHKEYMFHKTVPSTAMGDGSSCKELPPITSRIFEFLPQYIQALTERANSAGGGDVCTGFQALVAHIWKHVTIAHGVEASQQVKIGWAVDGRKRFNPPLPPNYFGNAIFYGYAEESAGDVMAQPMGHAAMHIRRGTQRVTDEYMRSAVDLIASQASATLVSLSFKAAVDLGITSWKHFKAYEVDWGWGLPLFFALPIAGVPIPIGGGLVVLLPHAIGHGVNALITLFQPHMDALLLDTQFYQIEFVDHFSLSH